MARAISDNFLNDLIKGSLSKIREIILRDDTLMLDLRGKSINRFYCGHNQSKSLHICETKL